MRALWHILCRPKIRHQATTGTFRKACIILNLNTCTAYRRQITWLLTSKTTSTIITLITPTPGRNGWRILLQQTTTALMILHPDKAGALFILVSAYLYFLLIFHDFRAFIFERSLKILSTSSLIAVVNYRFSLPCYLSSNCFSIVLAEVCYSGVLKVTWFALHL
jgi:hypothetical protein